MKLAPSLGLAAAFALVAASASAQSYQPNPNAPLSFSADEVEVLDASCTYVFSGAADITQDRTRVRANDLRVVNERAGGACRPRVVRIEASGDAFYVTPDLAVRADNAVYTAGDNTVVFTGNVIAVQGRDVSTGDRMVYNTETGAADLSGQVRGVIYPDDSSGAGQ